MEHLEYFPAEGEPTAVILVAHGLNTRPEVMYPLAEWMRKWGSEAFLLKLYGHREGSPGFGGLEERHWVEEFLSGYQRAAARAELLGLPLWFLGFSMGALLAQYVMYGSGGQLRFDKQVLMAPATAIRSRAFLLRGLFFLPEHWRLPSQTPEGYRANRYTTIGAFKVLFRMYRQVASGGFRHLNLPTLIIMDPKDELLSLRKLRRYREKFGLDNYHFLELNPQQVRTYHHLIIDEASAGPENWRRITSGMADFFFAGPVSSQC